MIKLGPQLFTARQYTQTLEGIEGVFQNCHENEYDTVQISGFGPVDFNKLEALIRKYDIDVCATHSPFARMENDLPALMEEHKRMNCPVIGLGSMPPEYRGERIEEFCRKINAIGRTMKENGLQFAYHNHCMEFAKVNGRLIMDYLLEETDPDYVHFIPDTYWLQMGGVDPAQFLREKMNGRVDVCHFKDLGITDWNPTFFEVGEGNLDLEACYESCLEIGVKAIVIEQDICPRDPMDCLKHSYDNLVKIARDCGDR